MSNSEICIVAIHFHDVVRTNDNNLDHDLLAESVATQKIEGIFFHNYRNDEILKTLADFAEDGHLICSTTIMPQGFEPQDHLSLLQGKFGQTNVTMTCDQYSGHDDLPADEILRLQNFSISGTPDIRPDDTNTFLTATQIAHNRPWLGRTAHTH